jgi:hypothetical protein
VSDQRYPVFTQGIICYGVWLTGSLPLIGVVRWIAVGTGS